MAPERRSRSKGGEPKREADELLPDRLLDDYVVATETIGKYLRVFLDEHFRQEKSDAELRELVGEGAVRAVVHLVRDGSLFPVSDSAFWSAVREDSRLTGHPEEVTRLLEHLAADGCRLCMTESHRGLVAHRHDEEIVVVYDAEDDLIEHAYEPSQFIAGNIPEEGDSVEIFVYVVMRPPESDETVEPGGTERAHETPRRRKNTVTGPQEF